MTVLLDLDCVLADFVGGVARLWSLTTADLLRHWPAGEYGMEGPVSRATRKAERDYRLRTRSQGYMPYPWVDEDRDMTVAEFWRPINSTPGFWLGLDPLPWAHELFRLCLAAAGGSAQDTDEGDVCHVEWGWLFVVTSPSRCPGCIREKEDWLLRHFGLPHDRMIPTPHKELLAVRAGAVNSNTHRPDWGIVPNLLVDDYDRNVDRFRAAGGLGILFPARHNEFHADAHDPLRLVRPYLQTLARQGA